MIVDIHSVLGLTLALHTLVLIHVLSSPMADILHFLLRHGYPVLFGWVFLEQAGLPMPSSPLLFVAGALAGAGRLHFTATLGLVMVAAVMADTAWFLWGRWRGAGVLRIVCRISLEPDTCVRRTKEAVARHGRLAILASKFVPGLNAAVPPLAGVTGMGLGEYLALDCVSALLWAGAFMGLGRIFSRQLDLLAYYVRGFGGAVLALMVALLAFYIARKYIARRKLLRSIATGTSIMAAPMTYKVGGTQYIAVVAGGGGAHGGSWKRLFPEIVNPSGGTTLWVFKLRTQGDTAD